MSAYWRLLLSATAAFGLGLLPLSVLPMLIGTWIEDLGASESRAGLIGAAEIAAIALGSIALAARVHAIPRRRLAVAASVAVALSNSASALVRDLDLLLAVRLVGGVGEGMLLAIATAVIAGARDPERLYAWTGVLGGLVATAVMVGIPLAIASAGTAGAFLSLAAVAAASVPFVSWLPDRPERPDEPDRLEIGATGAGFGGRVALLLLAAGLLAAVGQSAVWAFSERIGEASSLSPAAIGWVLGMANLAGISGSVVAGVLGADRGRAVPLAAGYASVVLGIGLIASAAGPAPFTAGQLLLALAYYFLTPYVAGLAAQIDPAGRLPATLGAAMLIGASLGPGMAGLVVEGGSYVALGLVAGVQSVASALLLWPVLRALSRPVAYARPAA